MKTALLLTIAALLCGCTDNKRIAELEARVAKLEAERLHQMERDLNQDQAVTSLEWWRLSIATNGINSLQREVSTMRANLEMNRALGLPASSTNKFFR